MKFILLICEVDDMKKRTIFYLASFMIFSCFACNQGTKTEALDLMKHGLPIKINAPADAEVKSTDYGFAQDVTVKAGEDYDIQIIASDASNYDIAKLKAEKLAEVKTGLYFSKIIEEDDNGFVFEKMIDETRINYDFRYVKIQGSKEYVFQTGLIGKFTEDQVKKMFASIKK